MISGQLDRHLPEHPARALDVGAGQGTQSIRLARAGHHVVAVEPDPDMRAVFRATLDAEAGQVRDRVMPRDGSVGSLRAVTGGEVYDIVLLMGVLMYLSASPPVMAELAAHVAPGGFIALAVRTTTSALWRPAARQDWQAALGASRLTWRNSTLHRHRIQVSWPRYSTSKNASAPPTRTDSWGSSLT